MTKTKKNKKEASARFTIWMAVHPGHCSVLVSTASPFVLVVARAKDADLDCGAVVRALCARFGGRGGGKPDLAQAGGLTGDTSAILDEARRQATQAVD